MTLYDKIIALYPELNQEDFSGLNPTIRLRNDGDGDYIEEWNHPTLKKPTDKQLV